MSENDKFKKEITDKVLRSIEEIKIKEAENLKEQQEEELKKKKEHDERQRQEAEARRIKEENDKKQKEEEEIRRPIAGFAYSEFQAMDLNQKIEKFYELKFKGWKEEYKPFIKEIKMSNDGIYLFVCKKY